MTCLPRTRPGGRTARVRADVLQAVRAELVQVGYSGLSYEQVAVAAGVHKTTIYRRWPGKDDLIADALSELASQAVPLPDTGSVAADLRALITSVHQSITCAEGGGLLRAVLSADNPPAVRAPVERLWADRFEAAAEIVRRAKARGELAGDADPQQLLEALVAPLFLRVLVTGAPVDDAFLDRAVATVLKLGRC